MPAHSENDVTNAAENRFFCIHFTAEAAPVKGLLKKLFERQQFIFRKNSRLLTRSSLALFT